MLRTTLSGLLLASLFLACGGEAPPPATPPPAEPTAPPTPLTAANPPPTDAKPAELTEEDKKKAAAAKELAEDKAKWEDDQKAELARWTPEMHKDAQTLADKAFPTGKAAIQAAAASKHRAAGHAERDKFRHPAETLDFFGLKPTMSVLEIGPGDGWYSELLAPALAKKGKLFATSADPNGPPEARGTFYGQRWKQFMDRSPELYGKVQTVVIDGKDPKLNMEGTLDMVVLMRGMHGWVNGDKLGVWLGEINKALKPNGVLGIEEHRAKPDADPKEASKKGYVPEKWAIEQVEAAGFKLAGKSEINANPKDTKDYAEGVWTLPPTLTLKDKDREKYLAIGESDRMTLKFIKVPPKAAPKAAGAGAGAGAAAGATPKAGGTATPAPAGTGAPKK
jgi:predicted methyltransferase